MDRNEAQAALAAMGDAKAALARAADCPPWRHAAFGGLMGTILLSQGLTAPLNMSLLAVAFAGIVALVRSDRKRMGVFVNGYRKGATRPLTFVLLGVMLVLSFAEIRAKHSGMGDATLIAIPLLGALLATAFSVKWQAIFRKELGL